MSSLPPEIGNLTNLTLLVLGNNQLGNLPSEIGTLNNLQELYLQSNELNSLPPEIGTLNNLQELYLQSNELNSLPPEIGNLNNLQELYLTSNELNSLPPEIGNLTNLCYLNIQNNQLRHLPTELSQLDKLTVEYCWNEVSGSLSLSGNPLISPPEEVIAGGTSAILDYLNNQAWWHLQRLLISITSGVGFITIMILGLRYRQRRNQHKPKAKRSDIS